MSSTGDTQASLPSNTRPSTGLCPPRFASELLPTWPNAFNFQDLDAEARNSSLTSTFHIVVPKSEANIVGVLPPLLRQRAYSFR